MIEAISFYFLAALLILFAYKVVTTPYVVRSAVYLINTLLVMAGLYLLLGAEFTAAIQILVYVGGIVVITIFAILLVSQVGAPADETAVKKKRLAMLAVGLLVVVMVTSFFDTTYSTTQSTLIVSSDNNSARDIGELLLSLEKHGFILPFEIISLLLLATLIGSIVIARTKIDKDSTESSSEERRT